MIEINNLTVSFGGVNTESSFDLTEIQLCPGTMPIARANAQPIGGFQVLISLRFTAG